MASARKFQSAGIGALPPAPDMLVVDPLVADRTRFSENRAHRFTLFRHWGDPDNYVAGIMMNPSGADEFALDPTVNKMCVWARNYWKVGAYYQLNAMSIRLTDSTQLPKVPVPNLPENDEWIRRVVAKAQFVVLGWGNPGAFRAPAIERILLEACDPAKVFCFKKNQNGSPVHPRYTGYDSPLIPYFETTGSNASV